MCKKRRTQHTFNISRAICVPHRSSSRTFISHALSLSLSHSHSLVLAHAMPVAVAGALYWCCGTHTCDSSHRPSGRARARSHIKRIKILWLRRSTSKSIIDIARACACSSLGLCCTRFCIRLMGAHRSTEPAQGTCARLAAAAGNRN